jgi:hypothetical protein
VFVSLYRYRVPEHRRGEFLGLQEEVSTAYRGAGAVATLLLEPRPGGTGMWVDISLFASSDAAEAAEEQLQNEGVIGPLFRRFLQVTGLTEEQIRHESFDVALCAGSLQVEGRILCSER